MCISRGRIETWKTGPIADRDLVRISWPRADVNGTGELGYVDSRNSAMELDSMMCLLLGM